MFLQAFPVSCDIQSDGDDCLHQPVRQRLHGDPEHAEVCESRPQHQEQSDGEPGPGQSADQRFENGNRPLADGADGV